MWRRRYQNGGDAAQPEEPGIDEVSAAGEGGEFSGRWSPDPEGVATGGDETADRDDLRVAYEEAVRRAAEWYRSRLFRPNVNHEHGPEADAPAVSGSM